MEFVAFDFETANENISSACALGLVTVRDGEIRERFSCLIRPVPFFFRPFNVRLHGISASDVIFEPDFKEIWPRLKTYFEGRLIIAHNAAFDIAVLRSLLRLFNLRSPASTYFCTVRIARKAWPGLPSYRLNALAREFGISFRHHDAVEDARACAEIARRAGERMGCPTLPELARKLNIDPRALGKHPAGVGAGGEDWKRESGE